VCFSGYQTINKIQKFSNPNPANGFRDKTDFIPSHFAFICTHTEKEYAVLDGFATVAHPYCHHVYCCMAVEGNAAREKGVLDEQSGRMCVRQTEIAVNVCVCEGWSIEQGLRLT
jgi:hypothetical protein